MANIYMANITYYNKQETYIVYVFIAIYMLSKKQICIYI